MRQEDHFHDKFSDLFDEAYDVDSTPLTDAIQTIDERYIDFKFYSEGGLKTIQLCRDLRTNRQVAMATLKVKNNKQRAEAFLKEAKLNAALQHPNIVPVYDIGMNGNDPWFTMKFISGQSLEETITELKNGAEHHFAGLNERLDLFIKMCDAIAYAHAHGILHLDLKPDNIRLSDFGDVVVCDWGLADIIASQCDESLLEYCDFNEYDLSMMTLDGTIKGTLGYMAPEQTTKTGIRKGKHTDIFSLGAILYSLLCYEKAFKGKDFKEAIENTANCKFPKPSVIKGSIPFSLEAVCLKAMSLNVDERYISVENLQKDILNYRNGFATRAENASAFTAIKLLILRNKLVSIISLITIALIISLGVVSISNLNLAKTNALRLAEKLKIEKEFHQKINKDAAPVFLERALVAYQVFSFADSLNFCTSAVELDSSLEEAWKLKANLHFIFQEFQQSIDCYEQIDSNSELIPIAQKYLKLNKNKQTPLKIELYLDFMRDIQKIKNNRQFSNLIHYKAYSKISIKERIKFCEEVLKMYNPQAPENFRINFNRQTQHLDLSNNSWLRAANCLQNFPAFSANLSGTSIRDFISFRAQKLTSLNVSHTNIVSLHTLGNDQIKELNISYTAIQNLAPLEKSSIEVINVSHSRIHNLDLYKHLPQIKKIYAHKGQFTEYEISQLPKNISLILTD